MQHNILGLVTYLIMLVGIHFWPDHEASVGFCCYGGATIAYAALIAIGAYAYLQQRPNEDAAKGFDMRRDLPGYAGNQVAPDLRSELPGFAS